MKEIKVGDKVKIKFIVSTERVIELSCSVKRVEYDRLAIQWGADYSLYSKYLYESKELHVVAYTSGGVLVFESIVIDSPMTQEFVIELPGEMEKVQRRDYVRATLSLDMQIERDGVFYKTKTVNIGGGGIRFENIDSIGSDNSCNIFLKLPNSKEPISAKGKILYKLDNGNEMYSVVKFKEIEEFDRDKIIKLCFEQEALSYRRN